MGEKSLGENFVKSMGVKSVSEKRWVKKYAWKKMGEKSMGENFVQSMGVKSVGEKRWVKKYG